MKKLAIKRDIKNQSLSVLILISMFFSLVNLTSCSESEEQRQTRIKAEKCNFYTNYTELLKLIENDFKNGRAYGGMYSFELSYKSKRKFEKTYDELQEIKDIFPSSEYSEIMNTFEALDEMLSFESYSGDIYMRTELYITLVSFRAQDGKKSNCGSS